MLRAVGSACLRGAALARTSSRPPPGLRVGLRPRLQVVPVLSRGFRHHEKGWWEEKDDMGVLEDGTITPVADSELFRKNYQFISDARKEEIYRLHKLDPKTFDVGVLSYLFALSKVRIDAIITLKADEVDQRLRRRLFTKADEAAPGEDPMGLMFADEMVLSEKLENLTRPPGHPLGGKKSIHNAIMFQAVADEYQRLEPALDLVDEHKGQLESLMADLQSDGVSLSAEQAERLVGSLEAFGFDEHVATIDPMTEWDAFVAAVEQQKEVVSSATWSALKELSAKVSEPGFEALLSGHFSYVSDTTRALRLPPEVAKLPKHIRNDWGRSSLRATGLQNFLSELGKHSPDTPPPPPDFQRLKKLCAETKVDRVDALHPILKEPTVDWPAFVTTATQAATEMLQRFQQRQVLSAKLWAEYLAKLRDGLAQRLSGAVRPEPLQGLDKAVATLKRPQAAPQTEEQLAEIMDKLEELNLLPPPRDLQQMVRDDWAGFQAKAMQPVTQRLEWLAKGREELLGPDLIEATKALRALSPEERQAAMTPPIDLAAKEEEERAFEEKWEGVSFERQPSPPHGFSRDARIAQGLLEDPHFLPYHATLGLEQKRVELLHKAQRLTTRAKDRLGAQQLRREVATYHEVRANVRTLLTQLPPLQASLETEADAAVAKGLWKQVRSVAKEVKAELGLLGLGHGPVSRWDVEEQQQHLIDDLVKAENDDRRTLLLQALSAMPTVEEEADGAALSDDAVAKLRAYLHRLHALAQVPQLGEEATTADKLKWEVLQELRRVLRSDPELYKAAGEVEVLEKEVGEVLEGLGTQEVYAAMDQQPTTDEERTQRLRQALETKDPQERQEALRAVLVELFSDFEVEESDSEDEEEWEEEEGLVAYEEEEEEEEEEGLVAYEEEEEEEEEEGLVAEDGQEVEGEEGEEGEEDSDEEEEEEEEESVFERADTELCKLLANQHLGERLGEEVKNVRSQVRQLLLELANEGREEDEDKVLVAMDKVPMEHEERLERLEAAAALTGGERREALMAIVVDVVAEEACEERFHATAMDLFQSDVEALHLPVEEVESLADMAHQLARSDDALWAAYGPSFAAVQLHVDRGYKTEDFCNLLSTIEAKRRGALQPTAEEEAEASQRRYLLLTYYSALAKEMDTNNDRALDYLGEELAGKGLMKREEERRVLEHLAAHVYDGDDLELDRLTHLMPTLKEPEDVQEEVVWRLKKARERALRDTGKLATDPTQALLRTIMREDARRGKCAGGRHRAQLKKALNALTGEDMHRLAEELGGDELPFELKEARAALQGAVWGLSFAEEEEDEESARLNSKGKDDVMCRVMRAREAIEAMQSQWPDEYAAYVGAVEDEVVDIVEDELREAIYEMSEDTELELDPRMADFKPPEVVDIPSLRMRVLRDDELAINRPRDGHKEDPYEELYHVVPPMTKRGVRELKSEFGKLRAEAPKDKPKPFSYAFKDVTHEAAERKGKRKPAEKSSTVVRDGRRGVLRRATHAEEKSRSWHRKTRKEIHPDEVM